MEWTKKPAKNNWRCITTTTDFVLVCQHWREPHELIIGTAGQRDNMDLWFYTCNLHSLSHTHMQTHTYHWTLQLDYPSSGNNPQPQTVWLLTSTTDIWIWHGRWWDQLNWTALSQTKNWFFSCLMNNVSFSWPANLLIKAIDVDLWQFEHSKNHLLKQN